MRPNPKGGMAFGHASFFSGRRPVPCGGRTLAAETPDGFPPGLREGARRAGDGESRGRETPAPVRIRRAI